MIFYTHASCKHTMYDSYYPPYASVHKKSAKQQQFSGCTHKTLNLKPIQIHLSIVSDIEVNFLMVQRMS